MNWVTGQHLANPGLPAVANVSLGTQSDDLAVENAVTNSMNAGVTYVSAAGNENQDSRVWSPQNVNDVLNVGAVDWNGSRWSLSNWGPGLDLFAPGVLVVSALTGNGLCLWNGANNNICILSGTSWAAPHVTGAVAMYLQNRPGQTSCGPFNRIQGPAPPSGNASTCPDRVNRFIIANARRDILNANINGTLPSPNRYLSTVPIPGPANPIENNPFFAWSQYVDFLNREPDSGGFANWLAVLNQCSTWPCINDQRIHTVRGFIESGEFRGAHPILNFNNPGTQAYNEEYVRQLYLCLLRREPDAGGLANWLSFLNSTGDYSHVVHGFINSTEYRRRFGPQ
jgi:subtilisin family serine protease